MTYRLTRRARQDVLSIWRYIADGDESAADRFIDLLTQYFRLLGENPMPVAGDELRPGYRSFPSGNI
jgi:plasmid stabilization system protein ParE